MLLNLTEDLPIGAPLEDVWKLLRDTPRLTELLPGVKSVTSLNEPQVEAYAVQVLEQVGPFRITLDIDVRVTETQEPSLLKASLKGIDSLGLTRVTGSMEVALVPVSSGTHMHCAASIEVLGKLATLGAVPIRRRTNQSFSVFARNIKAQFVKEGL